MRIPLTFFTELEKKKKRNKLKFVGDTEDQDWPN